MAKNILMKRLKKALPLLFAQKIVNIMKIQNMGGSVMFNISKQAINPGKNFGPYGLAKSSTLFLMKQYALECGKYNIRVNGVNADRIQSGLLTDKSSKLSEHFKGAKKDKHSSVGLAKSVNKRKKLLVYLKKKNSVSYQKVIKQLNLRK